MVQTRTSACLPAFALAFATVALCGGCSPEGPPGGPCSAETRADSYSAGQSVLKTSQAGLYRVRLVEADPMPPIKGDNAWTLLVEDPAGAPLSGATVAIKPYMPDHQHGTSIKAVTTPLMDAGRYRITPINLFMSAFWEVRVTITPQGGAADQATFGACVEG